MGTGRNRATSSERSGPRAVALRAVRRVIEQGAYSNLAVPAELDRAGLGGRDRALAAELAFGTIRRLIPIDAAIALGASRAIADIDPEALALVRLGAYQLLFTRIPAHAAVSATVDLAAARRRGFVNAVLRALSSVGPPDPRGSGDRALSLRTGLAPWAVAELRRLLPVDEVEPAAAALGSPADLTLRVNRCVTEGSEVEAAFRGDGYEPILGARHPDVLRVPGARAVSLPGYERGWFAIQDEASALVGAAVQARPGERIVDACAGPGGKAADLACQVGSEGLLVAADHAHARVALVRTTARRLRVEPAHLVQDATRPALRLGVFDAVLVDAPCSGLGAARRRPELLWRRHRSDLSRLARLQVAILVGVAPLVRPGGRLVYSVCTYPRAETDAVVRAFLAKRQEFEPAPVPGPEGQAPTHRMWPHRLGTDAMFVAGFVRRPG